jgi:hypothetical protein
MWHKFPPTSGALPPGLQLRRWEASDRVGGPWYREEP